MGPIKPGEIIDDRYLITAIIGSGGMGSVYAARELLLERVVAIKLIHQTLAGDDNNLSRFRREAEVLSKLSHKNIIRVFRYGVWRDMPYLVMELLEGCSLQELLQKNSSLDARRALSIALQIASSLSLAHQHNIIHRDLKPSNIFISKGNEVKLLDFGLCKILPNSSEEVQNLTQSGMLIGSVHYMSPEMCMGKPADSRSDIYALGALLYEMLTGNYVFDSDNPVGLLYKHINDPVPSLQENYPFLPYGKEIDELLQKCLAKKPEDRFQDAATLHSALNELSDEMPDSEPLKPHIISQKQSAAKKRWLPLAVSLATIVILALFSIPALSIQILCLPAFFLSYEAGFDYKIGLLEFLHKQPLLSGQERALLSSLAQTNNAGKDKIFQAYALSRFALAELSQDKQLAVNTAQSALKILSRELFSSLPQDQKHVELATETISNFCKVVQQVNSNWPQQLDGAVTDLNNACVSSYPKAILPLNQLQVELCLKKRANYSAYTIATHLSQLAANYARLHDWDEALKYHDMAISSLRTNQHNPSKLGCIYELAIGSVLNSAADTCIRRQEYMPSSENIQQGLKYCKEGKDLLLQRLSNQDFGQTQKPMTLVPLAELQYSEARLRGMSSDWIAALKNIGWITAHAQELEKVPGVSKYRVSNWINLRWMLTDQINVVEGSCLSVNEWSTLLKHYQKVAQSLPEERQQERVDVLSRCAYICFCHQISLYLKDQKDVSQVQQGLRYCTEAKALVDSLSLQVHSPTARCDIQMRAINLRSIDECLNAYIDDWQTAALDFAWLEKHLLEIKTNKLCDKEMNEWAKQQLIEGWAVN